MALELHEYRSIVYRLTLDSIDQEEGGGSIENHNQIRKIHAVTSPEVAVRAMRRAILTRHDVRHAVYRAEIGYVDFIWGTEGKPPSASGRRKGAMGVAHMLEARVRKDGLTPKQAELMAEQVARAVAIGEMMSPVEVGGVTNIKIRYGRYTAALVKSPGENAWLLTGFEDK